MTRADNDNLPWPPPRRAGASARRDMASPATQIVSNADEYLGGNAGDIGRRIAEDHLELFVTGDPVQAVAAEFERLKPEYIALHDLGGNTSARLVAAIATATRKRVQRLAVRRQGPGVPLAVLQFVELALGAGRHIRVYTTEIDADTQTRHQLAMLLLAGSRLGAVMVGDLPAHVLASGLMPLQQALAQSNWRCRELLLLPLGAPTVLASQSQLLARPAGVSIRVTPQAARPNDAWSFVSGAWNRLSQHDNAQGSEAARPGTWAASHEATRPMALDTSRRPGSGPLDDTTSGTPSNIESSRFGPSGFQPSGFPPSGLPSSAFQPSGFEPSGFEPSRPAEASAAAAPPAPVTPAAAMAPAMAPVVAPAVAPVLPPMAAPVVAPLAAPAATPALPAAVAASPIPMPTGPGNRWEDYASRCVKVKGAVAACVFDMASRRVLGYSGIQPDAASLAIEGIALIEAFEAAARGLGLERTVRDAVLSIGAHHLLLHPLPEHPGIALHLVVDAATGNATLARMQLERIEL